MSRAGGLAAAVPSALLQGQDDALVDGAAFQLAVGLGGLRHGMVWCARRRSRPSASRPIVSSRAPGARSGVGSERVTPKSAAAGSDKVMTRLGPPARATASARTPWPAEPQGVSSDYSCLAAGRRRIV
jgi:hypothetical protein